jgi:RNA polymerase sigma factor (sigma-70 family)
MMQNQTQEKERWSPEEEAGLVEAARRQTRDFLPLYDHYVRPVFRYLWSRVGSHEDAEDLTAQTFLEALEALPRYREHGTFAAWLFSIARRKTADYFRKHPHAPLEDADAVTGPTDLPGEIARRDEVSRLKALIRTLPDADQELIRLHFTTGLTFREMAPVIGKSEDAVKKALYRLLGKLQSQLE